ncbi:Class B acid phosphatase (modular protein) [Candidatus Xenohaliotis californiensis]|uniref:Class B acid phosphatase n=2 Tax=Candidatus Xenohaliotis californiensis TaxID=84677 RepID=A0ABP0EV02_9RICK|nr:Class B acid phosphatase (modular protein) [Candidatus Xenohaliotis californiensis]
MAIFFALPLFIVVSFCDLPALGHKTVVCPIPEPGSVHNSPPGCFDFYTFSQVWMPEICSSHGRYSFSPCNDLYKTFDGKLFVHGLWPNLFSTVKDKIAFPMDCSNKSLDFNSLPDNLQLAMYKMYPGSQFPLLKHEWDKHGTCTGFSQEIFVKTLIDYQNRMAKFSTDLFYKNMDKAITYQSIIENYPGLNIVPQCNTDRATGKQYIAEIHGFWDKENNPLKVNFKHSRTACKQDAPIYVRSLAKHKKLNQWKSELNSKYKKRTLLIGFDIDDTLLFSSPGYQYLKHIKGVKMNSDAFWEAMNGDYDDFSVPINIGSKLLSFHKKRGDKIYFITNRRDVKSEKLTARMQQLFHIDNEHMNPIIFSNSDANKASHIKGLGLHIYYGDSDSDMVDAKSAGAQPVRIPRSSNSSNHSFHKNGAFGEVVLIE